MSSPVQVEESAMNEITLIGIDIGKQVFHLHAQDATGREVFRKKLSRAQLLPFFSNLKVVTVVVEACAAHTGLRISSMRWGIKPG
jgi:transposase